MFIPHRQHAINIVAYIVDTLVNMLFTVFASKCENICTWNRCYCSATQLVDVRNVIDCTMIFNYFRIFWMDRVFQATIIQITEVDLFTWHCKSNDLDGTKYSIYMICCIEDIYICINPSQSLGCHCIFSGLPPPFIRARKPPAASASIAGFPCRIAPHHIPRTSACQDIHFGGRRVHCTYI